MIFCDHPTHPNDPDEGGVRPPAAAIATCEGHLTATPCAFHATCECGDRGIQYDGQDATCQWHRRSGAANHTLTWLTPAPTPPAPESLTATELWSALIADNEVAGGRIGEAALCMLAVATPDLAPGVRRHIKTHYLHQRLHAWVNYGAPAGDDATGLPHDRRQIILAATSLVASDPQWHVCDVHLLPKDGQLALVDAIQHICGERTLTRDSAGVPRLTDTEQS